MSDPEKTLYQSKQKLDDERMYSFDLPWLDRQRLVDLYDDDYVKASESEWPWMVKDSGFRGWSKRGYSFPAISSRKDFVDPYIMRIVDFFGFPHTAVWWNFNSSDFDYPVHTDSNHFKKVEVDNNKETELYKVSEEELIAKEWPLDYNEIKEEGAKFALNFMLSPWYNGHQLPEPIKFTGENLLPKQIAGEIKSSGYYKSPDDYAYYYNCSLINTMWTHYVEGDRVHERLMFRLSVYGKENNFEDAKAKLKSIGL